MATSADFSVLGTDIRVLGDLDENEDLAEELECVAQDLINGWTQPTGIADGTEEGAQWGENLPSYLNSGLTPDLVFAVQVALEVQAERDDRIDRCVVTITTDRSTGETTIAAVCFIHGQPYQFTFGVSDSTLNLLQVSELG